jgi:hypothetical protein
MPSGQSLKTGADFQDLADRTACRPCAKHFNQPVNSLDLESKPVSQSIGATEIRGSL